MKLGIIIKNGQVADIENRTYINADIGIKGNRTIDTSHHSDLRAETVIGTSGCIILPGLIGFHGHVLHGGTTISANPDIVCLPNGVTSMVDAGSSGWVNYSLFYNSVIHPTMMKIKSYLNVVGVDLSTPGGGPTDCLESTSPANYNKEKITQTPNDNKDDILGLKLRYNQDTARGKQYIGDPLLATVTLTRKPKTSICVRITDSLLYADELIRYFEEGDTYTHCFHGTGHSILSGQEQVYAAIKEAQSRGVIFSCSNGTARLNLRVAQSAMEQGSYPDIVSTDLTLCNSLRADKVYNLLHIMSKYLNMGMSFFDVIRIVTVTSAHLMKTQGRIGALAVDAIASISIVKLHKDRITSENTRGKTPEGDYYLDNYVTICNGQIVHRRLHF